MSEELILAWVILTVTPFLFFEDGNEMIVAAMVGIFVALTCGTFGVF